MPIHIVQVEDDMLMRDILKRLIETNRPEITLMQFDSGVRAMPYIEQNRQTIDLVLLDIGSPGTATGLEVAKQIRQASYTGSIVTTSAYASPSLDVLELLQCEYLPKPWHVLDVGRNFLQYMPRPVQPTPVA